MVSVFSSTRGTLRKITHGEGESTGGDARFSADDGRLKRPDDVLRHPSSEGATMTPETLTSVRELDSRFSDGIQVKLLWCEHDGRLWVGVVDLKSRDSFCIEVHEGDRPLEVFRHPYAYASYCGILTMPPSAATTTNQALAA
jgi:hypothetical protein